jgi:hypothetical protein
MDIKDVGQDKAHKEVVEAYDAEHGKYNVPVTDMEDHLPTKAMPKGPDPDPFKLGPMGK